MRKKFNENLSSREEGLLDFRMDVKSLSELLKGTIDPTVRNEAEKKLAEVHKIIGFGPVLLQVLLYPTLPSRPFIEPSSLLLFQFNN